MKVGIITVHSAINYGAVFQAFALKEYIKKLLTENDTVNIIDYRPAFFEEKKGLHFSKDLKANLIELERLAIWSELKRRNKSFEAFFESNDSLSNICTNRETLSKIAAQYDILIAGSDQIWNFAITDGDKSFLLDIPTFNGKRISYASSLGNFRFYKSDEVEIKKLFDRFSAISCREADGCEYLTKLTNKECMQVCDPTLLLDNVDYSVIFENKIRKKIKKAAQKDYLLIYNLSTSNDIFDIAEQVANAKGLKIYQIFPSIRKNKIVDKLLNDISPEEFLYLYSKAKFIITNSFHGTCFSIIYKRDFYTVKPTGSNNRLQSLLNEAGILQRLLIDDIQIQNADITSHIDYEVTYEKLNRIKNYSKEYLINNLQE